MMNIRNKFKNLFIYKPTVPYEFVLLENNSNSPDNNPPSEFLPDCDVFDSLDKNYDYLRVQYNSLINSDIILRPFTININNKSYNSLFVGIDGMFSSDLVNNYLLRPLMENKSEINIKDNKSKNKGTVNIEDYIFNKILPQNTVKKINKFSEITKYVSSGDCALFVDTLKIAFVIDVKGFESRSITTPKNEIVVRGSQEAFVERLRTNTSILRRLINSSELIIENVNIGTVSKTNIAICYMKNIANASLVSEVKFRINNIDVDYANKNGIRESSEKTL